MTSTARTALVPVAILALASGAHAQAALPTLPVEVFVGHLELAADVGAGTASVVGGRAGLDLGRFTGARGFYWRSVDGPQVQGYGGELQLNLNAGAGVTPFLLGGLARLDFQEPDTGALPAPDDRTLPLVGAGLRVQVGRFGIQGALRSHLSRTDREDGGRDLHHTVLYSAGAAFRLGRTGRASAPAPVPAPRETRLVRGDTVFVQVHDTTAPERTITIPIPREGEIYLRYGPAGESRVGTPPVQAAGDAVPGTVDDATLELLRRRIVADLEPLLRASAERERAELREIVREELSRAGPMLDAEGERRLLERLDAIVALRLGAARLAPATDSLAPAADPAMEAVDEEPRFQPSVGGLRPYIGGNFGVPRQFIAGLRMDLGAFDAGRPEVRLIPEAALGIGQSGNSVLLAANVFYEPDGYAVGGRLLRPYGYAGAGFLFISNPPVNRPGREAVINLGYGLLFPIPNHAAELFVEHQGIDLFDLNRFIAGVRF